MSSTPVVYFLYGEDEVGISDFVAGMQQRMGDSTTAEMNTTRFENRMEMGELKRAATAVPFLAARRLVILDSVLGSYRSKNDQAEILKFLETSPESTAVVIIERSEIKERHWLLNWTTAHPEKAYVKNYGMLKGSALVKWIQDYAKKEGGEILPQAAQHLVALIGDDNRTASMEVEKLLAYVNYARPIDVDDVEQLTAPVQQGNIFAMVDALGAKNGRQALTMMHELMTERDAMGIFAMIIRQFRLLLQCKEMVNQNLPIARIAKELGVRDFVVSKLTAQARNFDQRTLEKIYQDLTAIDQDMKTGQVELDIALDMFVVSATER